MVQVYFYESRIFSRSKPCPLTSFIIISNIKFIGFSTYSKVKFYVAGIRIALVMESKSRSKPKFALGGKSKLASATIKNSNSFQGKAQTINSLFTHRKQVLKITFTDPPKSIYLAITVGLFQECYNSSNFHCTVANKQLA